MLREQDRRGRPQRQHWTDVRPSSRIGLSVDVPRATLDTWPLLQAIRNERDRHSGVKAQRTLATASILICLLAVFAPVATATASSNFGTRNYNAGKRYGGQVNIRTPTIASETIDADEISLSRIVAQNSFTSGDAIGLVQGGLYRSGSGAQLDNCGASINQYEMYTEILRAGSQNYTCTVDSVATPGGETNASIANVAPSADKEWIVSVINEADSSGPFLDPTYVGFGTAFVAIGGEINGPGNPANSSRMSTCYGCGTGFADPFYGPGWYVYTNTSFDKGGKKVVTPSNTDLYTPKVGWSVPDIPTPITISHTP